MARHYLGTQPTTKAERNAEKLVEKAFEVVLRGRHKNGLPAKAKLQLN